MADSILPDLVDLFERTVTISTVASRSSSGKPTYGAPVTYPARVLMGDVAVRTPTGTVIIGKGKVYIPAVVDVAVTDRITLPVTVASPATPPILSVTVTDDEYGGCYTTIIIG